MSVSTRAGSATAGLQRRSSGVVVVGASWGGLAALTRLIAALPRDFPLPVVVIQHRGHDSKPLLAELLQGRTMLRVVEPDDGTPLHSGFVYVAPADHHLRVAADHLVLESDAPLRHSRPSIDVTFTSAAEVFGPRVLGVVLTGANSDGSRGLRCIVDKGGIAIVQDPASAEMPVMPRAAQLAVPEALVLRLDDIAPKLLVLAGTEGGMKP